MIITTRLPIATLFFKHWHTDDTEVGIIVAKAEFGRQDDGQFRPTGNPVPLQVEDVYEGDPATGYLLAEQDIAPGKDGTDLIIQATARSPGGHPATDWPVSVTIPDRVSYGFRVRGPSEWKPGLTGWKLTPPEKVTEVPLHYGLAYGGAAPGPDNDTPEIYEFNPAGIGFSNDAKRARKEPFAAPQIGEMAEFMAADVRAEMTVHGFGPIAKAWLPRRSNAGTFDEEWQQIRHPRMPHDYSLRFWNSARDELQITPHLSGNEVISLQGVHHDPAPMAVKLPGAGLTCIASGQAEADIEMVLDTVTVDIRSSDPAAHKLLLVWRGLIRDTARFENAEITSRRIR